VSTKMLDAEWAREPIQPGRIAAGDAITIDVRVAFWRVPGGDSEAMRLVVEAESLCLAAPDMARELLSAVQSFRRGNRITEADIRGMEKVLAKAGLP